MFHGTIMSKLTKKHIGLVVRIERRNVSPLPRSYYGTVTLLVTGFEARSNGDYWVRGRSEDGDEWLYPEMWDVIQVLPD